MDGLKENKVIKVLRDMEDALARRGHIHFKKRFLNIYKTILSIEKHADCFVSDFSLTYGLKHPSDYDTGSENDPNNDINEKPGNYNEEFCKYQSETTNMDGLLSFIEDELCLKKLSVNDCSTDDENNKERERDKIDSNILAIEKKIRNYLKEYRWRDIYKSTNFDSFVNDPRLKTPMSKVPFNKCETPKLSKNFFTEMNEVTIANSKKRYSKREDLKQSIANFLEMQNDHRIKCYSNVDKNMNRTKKEDGEKNNEIKDFCDYDYTKENLSSHITLNKRGSIFKVADLTKNDIKEEEDNGDSENESEGNNSEN